MATGGSREHEDEEHETEALLSSSSDQNAASELLGFEELHDVEAKLSNPKQLTVATSNAPQPRRQSSIAQIRPGGTPRTPNRVRFDVDDTSETGKASNGHTRAPSWMNDDDYLSGDEERALPANGEMQRMPLLTDIEAPTITFATDFDPEDHLESARPRSNMRSAFMNMANSIM